MECGRGYISVGSTCLWFVKLKKMGGVWVVGEISTYRSRQQQERPPFVGQTLQNRQELLLPPGIQTQTRLALLQAAPPQVEVPQTRLVQQGRRCQTPQIHQGPPP